MANTLSAFKAEIWTDAIIENIVPQTVGLNFVNSNYEGTVDRVGGVVWVHTFGGVTIRDYDPDIDLVVDSLTGTKEALNISTAKYFNFAIDDIDEEQSNHDLVQGYAKRAAEGLAQAVDVNILSTTGHASNAITLTAITSANVDSVLMDANEKLDNQGVPRRGRWMVVTPKVASALAQANMYVQGSQLGDTLVSTARFPGATANEVEGYLGSARGFDIWLSTNHTKVSGDPRMIYGQGNPILFAAGIPTRTVELLRSEKGFKDVCRGLLLFGKLLPAESSKAVGTIISDETA